MYGKVARSSFVGWVRRLTTIIATLSRETASRLAPEAMRNGQPLKRPQSGGGAWKKTLVQPSWIASGKLDSEPQAG